MIVVKIPPALHKLWESTFEKFCDKLCVFFGTTIIMLTLT